MMKCLADRIAALIDRAGEIVEITQFSDSLGIQKCLAAATDIATGSTFFAEADRIWIEFLWPDFKPGMGFWFRPDIDLRGWRYRSSPLWIGEDVGVHTRLTYAGGTYSVAVCETYLIRNTPIVRLAVGYRVA